MNDLEIFKEAIYNFAMEIIEGYIDCMDGDLTEDIGNELTNVLNDYYGNI